MDPCFDTHNGGKLVCRYNEVDTDSIAIPDRWFSVFQTHGNNGGYWEQETGYEVRAPSVVELYENNIHGSRVDFIVTLRGSTSLVYNNYSQARTRRSIIGYFYEEEQGPSSSVFSPGRISWPAEDQLHNTFIWNNICNGVAQSASDITVGASSADYIQLNRDYFLHAPQPTGGREYFIGKNGASSSYPTDGVKYPTLGTMVFTSTGPNAHYPYIPYVYPHLLSVQGETGRLLGLQAAPSGSTLVLSWQPIIGAVSYRVVRDWQEAQAVIITGTGWTDSAPTGEHVYMVYALDNTGKILAAEGKLGVHQQALTLAPGWNWISFNVLPADLSLNSIFAGILAQIEQVKAQTQSAIRVGGAWKGDLADMSGIGAYKMYKVKVSTACTLTVTGTADLSANPISLGGGWNWVAYLPTTAMPIATALDSIKGQVLEVKSLTQSATYSGGSWSGTLIQLEPGQGYAIKMNAPGTLTYPGGQ
jgi:hypothetical protein